MFKRKSFIGGVFRRHNAEIFRYLYILTKNKETAEDLAAEVFIKFINTFEPKKSSPRTWLYILAKGIVLNYFESLKNKSDGSDQDLIEDIADLDTMDNNINFDWVINAINTFVNPEKDVLSYRIAGNLSFKEISRITNLSTGNLKVIYYRAFLKLKAKINGEK